MKKLFLIITVLTSFNSFGQFSVNVDYLNSLSDSRQNIGVNLQYLLRIRSYSLPGINTGAYFEIDNKTNSGNVMIPLNIQYRYYLLGAQSCCGGIYTEFMGGARCVLPVNKDRSKGATFSPSLSGGIGFYIPVGIDLGIRLEGNYSQSKINPYLGVKLGYFI